MVGLTTLKEFEKRLEDGRQADLKTKKEVDDRINNIVFMLVTKPRKWLDAYKTEILGSFIDWWDKMLDDNKKFKEEWDAILSK